MSETPRTDETLKFIRDQIVKDSATLVQDHPFYVLDVLGNLGRKLERELSAERQKREQAERERQCAAFDGPDRGSPCEALQEMERQRDEAREALARTRNYNAILFGTSHPEMYQSKLDEARAECERLAFVADTFRQAVDEISMEADEERETSLIAQRLTSAINKYDAARGKK
jgi:hypothetical protein